MRALTFVTGNAGKVVEARAALAPAGWDVRQASVPLVEVQADDLATVARAKVQSAEGHVARPFFLDDAGLFVDALGGFPGVYSAYALRTLGTRGLLQLLDGIDDRRARFECVVAYQPREGEARYFHGVARGRIAAKAADGVHGFGFDPIFAPDGRDRTFAEIPTEEKNRMSHRGLALAALARHLAEEP